MFIPNIADKQASLYDLAAQITKRDGPLQWSNEAQAQFDICRQALADILDNLAHPSPDANLRLNTDASNIAVGAVFEQNVDEEWQPLGFFPEETVAHRTQV